VRVHAEKTISQRGFDAEEGAALTFRFQSGVVDTFLVSDNIPSPYNFEAGTGKNPLIGKAAGIDFYRIFGSDATLSVPDMTRWSYDGTKKSWLEPISKENIQVIDEVPFELQLAHFVRVIKGKEAPGCTAEAGLLASIVCDAVKEAILTGETVQIETLDL